VSACGRCGIPALSIATIASGRRALSLSVMAELACRTRQCPTSCPDIAVTSLITRYSRPLHAFNGHLENRPSVHTCSRWLNILIRFVMKQLVVKTVPALFKFGKVGRTFIGVTFGGYLSWGTRTPYSWSGYRTPLFRKMQQEWHWFAFNLQWTYTLTTIMSFVFFTYLLLLILLIINYLLTCFFLSTAFSSEMLRVVLDFFHFSV